MQGKVTIDDVHAILVIVSLFSYNVSVFCVEKCPFFQKLEFCRFFTCRLTGKVLIFEKYLHHEGSFFLSLSSTKEIAYWS